MSGKFTLEAIFKARDDLSAVVGRVHGNLSKLTRAAAPGLEKLNRVNDRIAGGLLKVGAVGVAAGAALGAGMFDAVQAGADFEHTLVGAAAKFDPAIRRGSAAFAELKKAAFDVGGASEFGASKAAMALDSLAAAGMKPRQAISLLPGVIDFATASSTDLAEAADIATKSLGAFNLVTEDAAKLTQNLDRVSDTMAMTANITNANMGALFESIKEGGPIATTAGQSVETFLALAGQLANVGIEGSNAGTTLKNTMLTLAAPTKEAAGQLAALGIKTRDAKGNMLDALVILSDLEKKTAKMGTAKKAQTLEAIFGKIPLAGVSGLLSGGIGKVMELRTQLNAAGGSVKKVASIMRDDGKGAMDKLGAAAEAAKLAVAGVIGGPAEAFIKRITATLKKEVPEAIDTARFAWDLFSRGVSQGFGAASGIMGGLLTPIRAIGSSLGTWPATVENIGRAFGFLVVVTAAWGAFALAVKGAQAALVAYEVAVKAVEIAQWLANTATAAYATITESAAIKAGLLKAAEYASAAATWARNAAVSVGTIGMTRFTVATVLSSAKTGIDTGLTWLRQAAQWGWNAATGVGTGIASAFTTGTVLSSAKTAINTGLTWARQAAQWAINAAMGAGTLASTAWSIATGKATAATVAAEASLAPFLITVAAIAAAIAAIVLAYQQWVELSKQAGGAGGVWEGVKSFASGDGFFKGMDADLDRKAREEAAKRDSGQMVAPRTAGAVNETKTTTVEKSEVTLKLPPGMTADVKRPPGSKGAAPLNVTPSGGL
jgi:TP901 family phage tail tape measure protein